MKDDKFIIDTMGLKREVPLPSGMCMNRAVAKKIKDAVDLFLAGESTYGWFTIHADEYESCGSNTKPLGWHESGPNRPTDRFTG